MLLRVPHRCPAPRKGVVLLAVLIVVVLLTLAAYQFAELMMAEYKAADTQSRYVRARAAANGGINYIAAMLSNPDTLANTLNYNIYDNPQYFRDVLVQEGGDATKARLMFSIVGPPDVDSGQALANAFRFGVIDEAGKINLNALMKLDSSGKILHDVLLNLPNMTEDIVNCIIDWMDPDDDPQPNGAESDYYQTLPTPYRAKNGPLDTLEELLYVKGVTPELLYGNDRNRNGILDPDEDDGSGTFDPGWQAYLTVSSRERNVDSQGNPRINLNDPDLNSLSTKLNTALGADMANFILAYRAYGGSQSGQQGQGGTGSGAGGTGGTGAGAKGGASPAGGAGKATPTPTPQNSKATTPTTQKQATPQPQKSTTTTTTGGDGDTDDTSSATRTTTPATTPATGRATGGQSAGGTGAGTGAGGMGAGGARAGGGTCVPAGSVNLNGQGNNQIASLYDLINSEVSIPDQSGGSPTVIPSPLQDPTQLAQLLPILLDECTTVADAELPARVNVLTAPQAVLESLPGLAEGDAQKIMDARQNVSPSDPLWQTPTWLITEANFTADTLKTLDKYITSRSQVFRVQVLGYFDGGGPTVRVEAVIDTNGGRPRISAYRDLTEFGKGYDLSQVPAGQ